VNNKKHIIVIKRRGGEQSKGGGDTNGEGRTGKKERIRKAQQGSTRTSAKYRYT